MGRNISGEEQKILDKAFDIMFEIAGDNGQFEGFHSRGIVIATTDPDKIFVPKQQYQDWRNKKIEEANRWAEEYIKSKGCKTC